MKKSPGLLLLLLFSVPFARAQMTDGPYVFYQGGTACVKSIQGAWVRTDSLDRRGLHMLHVEVDGHPDWGFDVRLKDSLTGAPAVYRHRRKTLVLSDIEGEFEPFRNLLLAAKVIDTRYGWTFGRGRLVIAGDLFDRGRQVAPFLWLLYKLEGEAAAKGGAVEVVLGNHDIMNLDGDYRYVDPAYFANAKLLGLSYGAFYAANTELGRWLRSKNVIEKSGGLLVMHGGMSAPVLALQKSVGEINRLCRPYYACPLKLLPDSLKLWFQGPGPWWYRGYFLAPKATQGLIDSTLAFYGCKRIIVGHDIIPHVAAFYNNKLIGVDVDEHQGSHEGLLLIRKQYYRIDDQGKRIKL